jgi:predicted dehydrogenase
MAVLNFASGVVGFWSYTSAAPGHQFTHVVYYGTEGALIDSGDAFHGPFSGALIHRMDGRVRRLSELQGEFLESLSAEQRKRLFPHNITDPFAIECYDFLDAIRSGRTPEVTAEDGMVDEAVAMAIYESATIGSQVKVKDVLDGKVETYQSDINAHWRL